MRLPARLRRVSKKGLEFIGREEGLARIGDDGLIHPYNDPVGYATIGYGHLLGYRPVRPTDQPITRAEALALLRKDVKEKAADPVRKVMTAAKYRPTQAEFDAIVSLVFNTGPGILEPDRSLGNAIRSKRRIRIANAILAYKMAGGRPILLPRRRRERRLFMAGRYR